MKKENAINFLLFSYFDITLEDNSDDKIIEAAVRRAYRDASSRVFSIKSKDKKYQYQTKKEAMKIVSKWIQDLLKSDSIDYTNSHKNICEELTTYYSRKIDDGNKKFTYGMAQKWINMTMKYLYVIKSIFYQYGITILKNLSGELEPELHVPIDGYILKSIYEQKPDEFPLNENTSWSKDDTWSGCTSYQKLQELDKYIKDYLLKEEQSILEWESSAWIQTARKIKENEKKKLDEKFSTQ